MEMLMDFGPPEVEEEAPPPPLVVGPGGLQNMSSVSRMVAVKGSEEEADQGHDQDHDQDGPPPQGVREALDDDGTPEAAVPALPEMAKFPSVEDLATAAAQSRRQSDDDEEYEVGPRSSSSPPLTRRRKSSGGETKDEDEFYETTTADYDDDDDDAVDPGPPLRVAGVAAIAALVYLCRKLAAPTLAFFAAVVGGVSLVLVSSQARGSKEDEWLLERLVEWSTAVLDFGARLAETAPAVFVASAAAARAKAEELWAFVDARAPRPAKQLGAAVVLWRGVGLVLGRRRLASLFRGSASAVAFLVGCFAYLPLYAVDRRGIALAKIVGSAVSAWTVLLFLDVCLGDDAAAAVAAAAWIAKPTLASLAAKLADDDQSHHTKDNNPKPTLRARDLGVALVATDVDSDGEQHQRSTLYLGFFATWFVANSQHRDGADPSFVRLD